MAAVFPMKKNVVRILILAALLFSPWAMAQTPPTLHSVPIRHVEAAYVLRWFGVNEKAPALPSRGGFVPDSEWAIPQGVSDLAALTDSNTVVFMADEKATEKMTRTLKFLDQPRVAYDIEWSVVILNFNKDRSFFGPIYEEMQRQNSAPLAEGFEPAKSNSNIFFPIAQGELERWKAAKRAGIIGQGKLRAFTNENAFIDVKVALAYIWRFSIRTSQRCFYAPPSPFSSQDENAFALEISDHFFFAPTESKPESSYVPPLSRGGYLHTDENWATSLKMMKGKNDSTVPDNAAIFIFKAHKIIVDREKDSKPKEIPKPQ